MHKFLEISYYNINDKKIERKKNSSDNLKGGQRTKKEGKRREENVVSRGIKSSSLVRRSQNGDVMERQKSPL